MSAKFWTPQRIERAKLVLAQSDTLKEAVAAMGPPVTEDSILHGFIRGNERPPSAFLRNVGPAPKAVAPLPRFMANGMSWDPEDAAPAPANCVVPPLAAAPEKRPIYPPFLDVPKPHRDYERNGHTIIIPDVHVPFHDQAAWEVCLRAIEELRPENVVLIGDFLDCYAITFFDKSPDRHLSLKDEIDAANPELKRVRERTPGRMVFTQGNHEYRFDRYMRKHPELFGLVDLREKLFAGIDGVEWVPYQDDITIGKVLYTHEVGHCGIHAARATLLSCGHNVVFGHTHRGAVMTDGDLTGDRRFALNVGWIGDLKQIDYMHRAKTKDWTHGFGHIFTDHDTGLVWPSFVPIMQGRCCVAGRKIAA